MGKSKGVIYWDDKLRKVLHYGSNRGRYGRESFRSLMASVQERLRVNTGFITPEENQRILDIYSFPDSRMDVRHYSLEDGNAFVLVTADRTMTSDRQKKELLALITGASD